MMEVYIVMVYLVATSTIQTNGVSFSLVVGSCCLVKFTNATAPVGGVKPGGYTTVNINSSGATKVYAPARYNASGLELLAKSGNTDGYLEYMTSSASGSDSWRWYIPENHVAFLVYDGTTYLNFGAMNRYTYSDGD